MARLKKKKSRPLEENTAKCAKLTDLFAREQTAVEAGKRCGPMVVNVQYKAIAQHLQC